MSLGRSKTFIGKGGPRLYKSGPSGGTPPVYFNDVYPNAEFLFAYYKLSASATNCVRLRRSGDNAEADFGFVNYLFDEAAAVSWVNAGGGTALGYIVKKYNQTLSGNDLTQTDPTQQQLFISASAVIKQDGIAAGQSANNAKYLLTTAKTFGTSFSFFSVAKWTATDRMLYGGSSTESFFGNLSNALHFRNVATTDYTAAQTITARKLHSVLNDASAFKIRTNAANTLTGTNSSTFQFNVHLTGFNSSNFYRFTGTEQVLIMFNTYQSDFAGIETFINNIYGIY